MPDLYFDPKNVEGRILHSHSRYEFSRTHSVFTLKLKVVSPKA